MKKYANNYCHLRPNNVVVHGSTEPILTFLELGGFQIRDLFLMGLTDKCGSIVVESEQRALEVWAALEPAHQVKIEQMDNGDWSATYDLRDPDGSVRDHVVTGVTLKGEGVVKKDGRWVN